MKRLKKITLISTMTLATTISASAVKFKDACDHIIKNVTQKSLVDLVNAKHDDDARFDDPQLKIIKTLYAIEKHLTFVYSEKEPKRDNAKRYKELLTLYDARERESLTKYADYLNKQVNALSTYSQKQGYTNMEAQIIEAQIIEAQLAINYVIREANIERKKFQTFIFRYYQALQNIAKKKHQHSLIGVKKDYNHFKTELTNHHLSVKNEFESVIKKISSSFEATIKEMQNAKKEIKNSLSSQPRLKHKTKNDISKKHKKHIQDLYVGYINYHHKHKQTNGLKKNSNKTLNLNRKGKNKQLIRYVDVVIAEQKNNQHHLANSSVKEILEHAKQERLQSYGRNIFELNRLGIKFKEYHDLAARKAISYEDLDNCISIHKLKTDILLNIYIKEIVRKSGINNERLTKRLAYFYKKLKKLQKTNEIKPILYEILEYKIASLEAPDFLCETIHNDINFIFSLCIRKIYRDLTGLDDIGERLQLQGRSYKEKKDILYELETLNNILSVERLQILVQEPIYNQFLHSSTRTINTLKANLQNSTN